MGRFDSFSVQERELLLRLLINYLDKSPPGDKSSVLGQSLLNEFPSTSRQTQMFASHLKKARKRAGFRSAAQFAKKIGLEPPAYRYYERGQAHPNLETLARICAELRCTPNDLLSG